MEEITKQKLTENPKNNTKQQNNIKEKKIQRTRKKMIN